MAWHAASHQFHHELHCETWKAAQKNQDSLTIHGTTIQNPAITFQLPSIIRNAIPEHAFSIDSLENSRALAELPDATTELPPAEGFILTGSVDLFGNDAWKAEFYNHHGPLPTWLDKVTDEHSIYQMAVLKTDLHISSLMPAFKGTPLDGIELKNISFTYQVRQHI